MWNPRAAILFCCLAPLPLIGCAGGPATAWRPVPTALITGAEAPRVDALAAPAAILVVLPGAGAFAGDPALWAAQGFDVVVPTAPDMLRLAAEREAAITRMIASAQALAAAPVWLLGPGPAIEAAMAATPPIGRGEVSGVVVTSLAAGAATCSRSVTYSYPGNGARPKVTVRDLGQCLRRRCERRACGSAARRLADAAISAQRAEDHRGLGPRRRAGVGAAGRRRARRGADQGGAADLSAEQKLTGQYGR